MAMQNGLRISNKIFILPPSLEDLRKRLIERGTDTPDVIERRLAAAQYEIQTAYEMKIFNIFIKNTEKDKFLSDMKEIIEALYPEIKSK